MGKRKESRTKNFIRALRDGGCISNALFRFDLQSECTEAMMQSVMGVQEILVDVPQLYSIIRNQSVEGINPIAALIDVLKSAIRFVYLFKIGSPLGVWLGPAIISTQKACIPTLIYLFNNEKEKAAAVAGGFFASVLLMMAFMPPSIMTYASWLEIPLLLGSTALQMYTNYQNEGTGALSVISKAMSLSSNAQDLILSAVDYYLDGGDEDDYMELINETIKVLVDVAIVGQFMYLNRGHWREMVGLLRGDDDD